MAIRLFPFLFCLMTIGVCMVQAKTSDDELRDVAKASFGELSVESVDRGNEDLISLGRSLFWDKRISANGKTSCASCHTVDDWGADRRQFSIRDNGNSTGRNSQTVFNSTLQPSLRWIGDRRSAAHQAERSITGSLGHESAQSATEKLIATGYEGDFQRAFPDTDAPVSVANFGRAIEAYEETLITPAPFDRFLAGDNEALSAVQKDGMKLFIDLGCADCHTGKLIGGENFETFGIVKNYWLATESEKVDEGLFTASQKVEDKYRFRVSMLRNIAKTGPYFHDGSVDKLTDAIGVMSEVQLGQEMSEEDRELIAAFLNSLTGEIPQNYSQTSGQ